MSNVVELGPRTNMTTEEALAIASREEWSEVLICGYHKDSGELVVRSSKMNRADALWLVESTKLHCMGRE